MNPINPPSKPTPTPPTKQTEAEKIAKQIAARYGEWI